MHSDDVNVVDKNLDTDGILSFILCQMNSQLQNK